LHHYFEDICEKVNVKTTLSEQEISDVPLPTLDVMPMLGYNDTSLFQDAIIYGMACNLVNTGLSDLQVPNVIYTEYISLLDLSTLSYQNEQYIITFCDLYQYCIGELKAYLNDTTQTGYLRRLLNLDPNIVSDQEIEFLIEHYTKYISEIIPDVDTESIYFKQAVYMQIACHIYRTNPTAIITPSEYRVDEVSETFSLAFDKFGNTWCDLAEEALADLRKLSYKNYGIKVFDRPGARTKYNAWGPQA
jgi:hypothetical protein